MSNLPESTLTASVRRAVQHHSEFTSFYSTGEAPDIDHSAPPPPPAGVQDGDLPTLPSDWKWVRLSEIADVVGGITKDAKKQADPNFPEVPYLRVANVQRGRLDLDSISFIRAPVDKIEQLRLQAGDVLLNEGGDRDKLGRGWIWEDQIPDCIHQNHVFRARIRNGEMAPKLLAWHANTFGKEWCNRNAKQSVNLASISLSKIRLLPVPVPPRERQAALVVLVDQHLGQIDQLDATLQRALKRTERLRQSLLMDALAGRLEP